MSGSMYSQPLRVAVLCGGDSPERTVSLQSGDNVACALRRAGHDVQVIDARDTWLERVTGGEFDVCFLALHGGAGEDGRIQQQLDRRQFPYTGSRPEACRRAMDKVIAKQHFQAAGLPTAPYVLLDARQADATATGRLAALGDWPLVVKPREQGSSLGLSRISGPDQLAEALREVARWDPEALIEPWIQGREFTVSVLDRQALPLLEIVTPRGWFDYQAKYESPETEYHFDIGLPAREVCQLQQLGVAAAQSLGTSSLVRVDLMVDMNQRPWILEVNTTPGMTDHSLAPMAAARAGMDLPALCNHLVQLARGVEVAA